MFPNRLKYIANRKKMQQATEAMTIDDGTADSGNEHDIYSEADAIADLNILKRSVINDTTDMEMIKEKLNATRQYRLDLMKRHETDVREQFPFFFSHPNLVIILNSTVIVYSDFHILISYVCFSFSLTSN